MDLDPNRATRDAELTGRPLPEVVLGNHISLAVEGATRGAVRLVGRLNAEVAAQVMSTLDTRGWTLTQLGVGHHLRADRANSLPDPRADTEPPTTDRANPQVGEIEVTDTTVDSRIARIAGWRHGDLHTAELAPAGGGWLRLTVTTTTDGATTTNTLDIPTDLFRALAHADTVDPLG